MTFENEGVAEEGAPTTEVPESPVAEQPEGQTAQPDVLDLDSVQKFKFGGREWTPKDFQGAYMMQSDYTRKTQALAEERKFYDNLQVDLDAVKRNPALSEQFKSIYPDKFHKLLGYVSPETPKAPVANETGKQSADPELLSRLEAVEADFKERKIQAINAELDNTFKSLSEKYPFADEESAIARGQALLNKGQALDKDTWDKIWKSVHDKQVAIAEKHYSQKINNQKNANKAGADVGKGGSTPAQPPKQIRTIKEASEHALRELEAN